MSVPDSSRLTAPFSADEVLWAVVEVADGGEEVRVVPRLEAAALRRRLDAVVGPMGWSLRYQPLAGDALLCQLSLGAVEKGAVAPPARLGGAPATADAAFAAAAELFGLRPPFADGVSAWVASDPDSLEPLHPPDIDPEATAPMPAAPGAAQAAHPVAAGPVAAADPATAASLPLSETTEAAPAKPEGQQMIDRLVERLRAEGQGLAAARLLVRHGGYGKDPEAARALYAELRTLLVKSSAAKDEEAAAPQPVEVAGA